MRTSITALLLALLATGCSDPDPQQAGQVALQSGHYHEAVRLLTEALKSHSPNDSAYLPLSVSKCQAQAHVDGQRARDEFLALAESQSALIQPEDFTIVVEALFSAKHFKEAVDVLAAGSERFPAQTKFEPLLAKVGKAVEKQARDQANPEAAEALNELKNMGYLGDTSTR